mmetsp:Transcript_11688/g.24917  ORF Transcript_11688/g.24917 Transcript_11688/m.24917 type:complete len:220 (+) Transcript_11688:465-1124(+)
MPRRHSPSSHTLRGRRQRRHRGLCVTDPSCGSDWTPWHGSPSRQIARRPYPHNQDWRQCLYHRQPAWTQRGRGRSLPLGFCRNRRSRHRRSPERSLNSVVGGERGAAGDMAAPCNRGQEDLTRDVPRTLPRTVSPQHLYARSCQEETPDHQDSQAAAPRSLQHGHGQRTPPPERHRVRPSKLVPKASGRVGRQDERPCLRSGHAKPRHLVLRTAPGHRS